MNPTRAYLDLNTFDEATHAWKDGRAFKEAARGAGFQLCLGTEVLHELIMRCKDPNRNGRAPAVAAFILGAWDGLLLVPALQSQMREESARARDEPNYREAVALHALEEEHLHQSKSREALLHIQAGEFAAALGEVQETKDESDVEWRMAAQKARKQAEDFLARHPEKRKEARSPEGFRTLAKPRLHLSQWLPNEDMSVIDGILENPKLYPVLNALVNVDIKIAWVAAFGTLGERGSKLDDYGPLVSASGMDLLVTNDVWLLERYQELSPVGRCMTWEDFNSALDAP